LKGKEMLNQRTRRIVLTGGPSAGKTTALAYMSNWCTEHGYTPLIVPEAATVLIGGGLNPIRPEFQNAVFTYVDTMERIFEESAQELIKTGAKPVIICDRGRKDQEAYMGRDAFDRMCAERGVSSVMARDEYYDGVIFLRSAANGAEEFYGNANNATRYESLEEARALDNRTLDAWVGTPHLFVIENNKNESFDMKMSKTVATLARILGEPEPVETERKFIVSNFNRSSLPTHSVAIDIVQTYLVSTQGHAERVRARGQNNQWVFTHTIKEQKSAGVSIERERIITEREYTNLLIRRDAERIVIHKTRYCFTHEGHYCELDVFSKTHAGLVILEIEVSEDDRKVTVPPYLGIVEEVTEDADYSNYALALKAA
jgi:CYTH domain-containing protein/predicted ATPase